MEEIPPQGGELTGLDVGLGNIDLAGQSGKSVDLSPGGNEKVSSYLAGIKKPSKNPSLSQSDTLDLDTTEDLGYGQSLNNFGRLPYLFNEFNSLSSVQFGAGATSSGISEVAEPSKIENLQFPTFGGQTKVSDIIPGGKKLEKISNVILLPFFLLVFGVFYYSLGDTDVINEFVLDVLSGDSESEDPFSMEGEVLDDDSSPWSPNPSAVPVAG